MTTKELADSLNDIYYRAGHDAEVDHIDADRLLLDFIADDEVEAAFERILKWYA